MEWDLGKECVVCGSPYVQIHHVYEGTANRKISDRYGYVIPLCSRHHTGQNGIHFNKDMALYWKRKAQEHFESNHGDRDTFRKTFGRSYL